MTTKRIILEQTDDGEMITQNTRPIQSNFDSFSDGFSKGVSFKGTGCMVLVMIVILLIIWLVV